MSSRPKPTVRFLKVWDNRSKVQAILHTVKEMILKRKRTFITVPNKEAATYLDELLWNEPEDSFIPHLITNEPCEELVAISQVHTNFNNAEALINLCPEISPISDQFELIFDLEDETSLDKANLSALRKSAYETLT